MDETMSPRKLGRWQNRLERSVTATLSQRDGLALIAYLRMEKEKVRALSAALAQAEAERNRARCNAVDLLMRAEQAEAERDGAYTERNQCVALIARMGLHLGWRAGVKPHEGEPFDPGWNNVVCIDLPTGQAAWHFHDREADLFAGLPSYPAPWDGHTTPEKYRRVAEALPTPAPPSPPAGEEVPS